jgi:hypothetical protein
MTLPSKVASIGSEVSPETNGARDTTTIASNEYYDTQEHRR